MFTNTTPTDAYRGAGRPEATYAIERAVDTLARKLGHGPRRDPAQELHHRVPRSDRLRARDRLGRLRRLARQGARARSTTRASAREQAERRGRRRPEADRHRLLDLRRDVRPRPVADPRRDPLRRRRLGRRHRPLPPDRNRPGPDRHLAARAGARDDLLADRRRPARRPDRERRGAARRHDGDPARDGHVREPQPRRRRRRPLPRHREGDREGADDRRPRARGGRGGSRVRGRPLHGRGHGQVDDRQGRRPRRVDGPQPPGRDRARPRGRRTSTTRRTSAGRRGCHIAVVEVDTETGRGRAASATSPSTTSAP